MDLRRTDNRKYPTLYASALLTLTKQGYTKHYFEGSRRICSKIGGGFSNVPQSDIDRRVAPVEPDYDEMHNSQRDGLVRTFAECLGAHPEPDAARDLREVVNGCLALNDPEPAFFYISDHLGGTSFLANASGNLTQTLSYLPYGEDWADVQNFTETRYPVLGAYAFSGKEKDYESALLYFGVRHHDSELLTAWLSVDPLADKYPSISPYAYCAWNPVKLVDPEGREIWIVGENGAKYKWEDNKLSCKIGRSYVEIKNAGKFVNGVAKNLNKINGTKEGKIVLDELSQSNEDYFIRSKQIGNSDAGYVSSQNSLYMNGLSNISVLSHELFHAYQDENGRSPHNIYNEVEAYVFQKMMAPNSENSGFSSENKVYEDAMNRLKDRYNSKDFSYAVSHFRRDSKANASGKYKNYEYVPKGFGCGNSLLKKVR